ncbi:MAG TPA: hypothetical protein VK174_02020, partial [Chitinophagales bacterium]|nr:hypothetical protein [Chitinophagales bacterium]
MSKQSTVPSLQSVKNAMLILVFAVFLFGCKQRPHKEQPAETHCVKEASLPVKYARGFAVDYYNGFKVITVKDQKDTAKVLAQY